MPLLLSAQSLSIALEPSDYNGYNISCFGLKDGAIDATITGGTSPYTVTWSNGATTEDLAGLASGYYKLEVMDADSVVASAQITLTEPMSMKVAAEPFRYPSGFNISCYECFNGSIDVTVYYGVPPYTYDWGDEVYTQDRAGLGSMKYGVMVTDANGCNAASETVYLTQPERKDWTMEGNANTDASQHFFGTTDAQDVVFKSNGLEAIRLLYDGRIRLTGLDGQGGGLLRAGPNGDLSLFQLADREADPYEVGPVWYTSGNFLLTQQPHDAFLGSADATPVEFRTWGQPRMQLLSTGEVGIVDRLAIGFNIRNQPLGTNQARLNLMQLGDKWMRLSCGSGGQWLIRRDLGPGEAADDLAYTYVPLGYPMPSVSALIINAHGGFRSGSFNVHADSKVSIGEMSSPVGLLNVGEDFAVFEDGKVKIGDVSVNTPNSAYKLYVEGGILTEKVRVALKYSSQWSDYVFNPGYPLLSLTDVRAFIEQNCHLPGVPSAEEVLRSGLDVAQTDALLLAKIEELMLYVLELENRLRALEEPKSGKRLEHSVK